jgi:hypothetical protein
MSQSIVCAIRKADYVGPAPSAIEAECSLCGAIILLARSGHERVARGYSAYCNHCIENGACRDRRHRLELPSPAELTD